jgi:hypothetical protein
MVVMADPSSIMERNPSPWFARNPAINSSPPCPVPILERCPPYDDCRDPYILIFRSIDPLAIPFHLISIGFKIRREIFLDICSLKEFFISCFIPPIPFVPSVKLGHLCRTPFTCNESPSLNDWDRSSIPLKFDTPFQNRNSCLGGSEVYPKS